MTRDPIQADSAGRPRGWFRSIQTRLVVLFSLCFAAILLAVEMVDLFGLPLTSFTGRQGHYELEATNSMNLIADLKVERLRSWLEERRRDLYVFATNQMRVTEAQSLLGGVRELVGKGNRGDQLWSQVRKRPDYQALAARFDAIKSAYAEYERIFLVDLETGETIVSTVPSDLGADNRQADYFRGPKLSGSDYLSDIQSAGRRGAPVLYLSRLARVGRQAPAALLVLEIHSDELLKPMLHTGEGLGPRGEAILINRHRQILVSLKHPLADGSRPEPLHYEITTEQAQRAARGEEGVIKSVDYRGEPVLAAYRYVQITPEFGWGLIVKRDRRELSAPLRQDMRDSLCVGLAGVAALVGLTVLLARGVTRPVRALSQTAREAAQGNLDARAPVTTSDEVGTLAATFNAMIGRIRDSQQTLLRQERLATLGQLTATVSHEIRNPLGTIRTSFFVIAQRLRGKGLNVESALERIERAITRCDAIIGDLLDYSRSRTIERSPTDVDSWLAVMLGEQAVPAGVTLQSDLASAARVPLDRERFRRCMVNLISNACQAVQPDGGQLTVSTRCEDRRLVVRVTDTGCGIPADKLEKVFEPLYSTKSFGVGLGLCIVKQIVEQHGGGVHIESEVGRGTTVTLRLPNAEPMETGHG